MKKIGDIIEFKKPEVKEGITEPLHAMSCILVDEIFTIMYLLCRNFKNYFEDDSHLDAEKTLWYRCFTDRKLKTQEQTKWAMRRLEESPYPNPPSLGEFLSWLTPTPESLGLPTTEKAYQEAIKCSYFANMTNSDEKDNYSHEIVKHAAEQTTLAILRNPLRSVSFPIFEHNYTQAIEMFVRGHKFETIAKAITKRAEAHPEDVSRPKISVKELIEKQKRDMWEMGLTSFEYHQWLIKNA